MTQIRSQLPVPIPTSRRIEPTGSASGSNDRQPRREHALVSVPTPHSSEASPKTSVRAQLAAAEVIVQVIAGNPRRGIRAETSEQARYRRAYSQAAQKSAPPPVWERRA
tara:strand:- start:922 stop:1248 length:327 start_codon:yes stop_codon:yes gene_type:complete